MDDPQRTVEAVVASQEKRKKGKNEDMGIQFGMSPIPFCSLCLSS